MITALYERLSRDDERESESLSIERQKAMLEEFAKKNGFDNTVHFTDDGISGTRWDRPGFLKMMDEIEAGNVAVCICKDMSRLGRDYLRAGLFIETLRQKGVRLIAIGDNVDTARGEDDFIPFRNIFAEWHARDTSRKLRAMFNSKGMNGKHTASHPPYGYIKSAEDKEQWVADPDAAGVVRRIFRMTAEGRGPSQIAAVLEAERVHSPSYHLARKGLGNNKNKEFPDPYRWHGTTICNIIGRVEYMGHTINFKTFKTSFKDKRRRKSPNERLAVYENTHERIIDPETWETANRIRQNAKRRRLNSCGEANTLTGLVRCSDCGQKLYNERGYTSNGYWRDVYICSTYRKRPEDCRAHRIHADAVNELTLHALRTVCEHADRAELTRRINEMFSERQSENIKARRKKLTVSRKRRDELDKLIQRIYEDNASGRITDKRFEVLSAEYEREQFELERAIAELQTAADDIGNGETERLNELTRRYTDITELSAPLLYEFVQKIVVHERADKHKKSTTQKVEIHLNLKPCQQPQ